LNEISTGGDFMLYLDAFFANLNLVVRIAGFLSCPENGLWANDNAEFEQNKFYYITKGSCVIRIEGREYVGKPGQCFFIPANTKHSYYNIQGAPFEKYWFHFDLYPSSDLFHLLKLRYCIHADAAVFTPLFDALFRKFQSEALTDRLDVKSLALGILSAFLAASHSQTRLGLPEPEEKISQVLAYIHRNLERPITNAELSALCCQHPNHFVRFFKKKTGTTPQKYITEQRIQMAKRLIEQTDLKFSDIAIRAGFCDAPHFSRVFKSYYSLTPQEYRKHRNRW